MEAIICNIRKKKREKVNVKLVMYFKGAFFFKRMQLDCKIIHMQLETQLVKSVRYKHLHVIPLIQCK